MFNWDAGKHFFVNALCCPYPDCGVSLTPCGEDRVLRTCPECGRILESAKIPLADRDQTIEIVRRPGAIFCPFTGKKLTGYSPLDWSEGGGGPGNTGCLEDPLGEVFGKPDSDVRPRLRTNWSWDFRYAASDQVAALLVAKGRLLCFSRGGAIDILDPTTGHPLAPSVETSVQLNPVDNSKCLEFSPAMRGTTACLVTQTRAFICDLAAMFTKTERPSPWIVVAPSAEMAFLAQPIVMEGEQPLFVLLEGAIDTDFSDAPSCNLRFFDLHGNEIGKINTRGIARAPRYDCASRRLVWVDGNGAIFSLPGQPGLGQSLEPVISEPTRTVRIPRDFGPLIVVAGEYQEADSGLWLIGEDNSSIFLLRAILPKPGQPFTWRQHRPNVEGEPISLAVGQASRYVENIAGRFVAITTDSYVHQFRKTNLDEVWDSVDSPTHTGARSSWDVPILTSAGMLTRTAGQLSLRRKGFGWKQDGEVVDVPGQYVQSQGLAMIGRNVFLGKENSVQCCEIVTEE